MKISYSAHQGNLTSQDVTVLFTDESDELVFTQLFSKEMHPWISQMIKQEEFYGKKGQTCFLHTPSGRILLIGVGNLKKNQPYEFRLIAAQAIRLVSQGSVSRLNLRFSKNVETALFQGPCLQFLVEGLILTDYRFDKYKTKEHRDSDSISECHLFFSAPLSSKVDESIRKAQILSEAVMKARDLVNEPPCEMTPAKMVEAAQDLAHRFHLDIKILSKKDCEERGMGLLLAVAKASELEPWFVHLTYHPKPKDVEAAKEHGHGHPSGKAAEGNSVKKVALVGKGITFDSGGLTLKTPEGMMTMKCDMAGGAVVLQTLGALAQLHCPYEVHAVVPLAENMVSGRAYRLGDIYTSMLGKTVEITNTDAEGRLILADAFAYVRKEIKPDEMFDFATLTGACMIALGPYMAGVMGNDQDLIDKWLVAAKNAGEQMWPFPLQDRIREGLKSDVADIKNSGPRNGAAIAAAHFLKEFVGDLSWVHVDFAGPAFLEKDWAYQSKGGTGYGISSLVEYLVPR